MADTIVDINGELVLMLGDANFIATDLIIDYIAQIAELVGEVKGRFKSEYTEDYWQVCKDNTLEAYLSKEYNSLDLNQMMAVIENSPLDSLPSDIRHSFYILNMLKYRNEFIVTSQDDLLLAHSWLVTGCKEGERVIDIVPPVDKGFSLLEDILVSFSRSTHHPLITSGLLHYELAQSLVFRNANRALGRLWQVLTIASWRDFGVCLNLEPYILQNQEQYDFILQESSRIGDERPFLEFMLSIVLTSIQDFVNLLAVDEPTAKEKEEEAIVEQIDLVEESITEKIELSEQSKLLIKSLGHDTCSTKEMMERVAIKGRPSFIYNYLRPAVQAGTIAMTHPDQPRSRNQKYYLTDLGVEVINSLT